jgi:polysaccharide biosynthesis transport protein
MSEATTIRQYVNLGLKWWWLIILATTIATGIGYGLSKRQIPVYQAKVTLIVGQSVFQNPDFNSTDLGTSQVVARTYADMTLRQPVLQGVAEALQLQDSWQSLKGRIQAKPVPGTQLLEITVQAPSPEEAQVTADEVARQLIKLSPTELQNRAQSETQHFINQRLEGLQVKIEAAQARLETLEASMNGSLSAEQVQKTQAEMGELETLIAGWEDKYLGLLTLIEGSRAPNYLAVIEPAQANSSPINSQGRRLILMTSLAGLSLALGLIFLIEYLDDSFKSPSEFSQILGLTVLGSISQIKGGAYQDKLAALKDLFSPESEAYRMIRSNIQFAAIDRPAKVIMVTSPTPGEGKSTTVANLGVVMAQAGLKTIIVDADLRRPVQHQIFQVPNMIGLTDLLRTPKAELTDHLKQTAIENLYLISSGITPPNPSELLGSKRMEQVVAALAEQADVVIFDSPPAVAVTDAAVLSTKVDGVVLVIEAKRTRRDAAKQALLNLQQAGAHLLGGVLNRFSQGGSYYYYYSANEHNSGTGQLTSSKVKRRWQERWLPRPIVNLINGMR